MACEGNWTITCSVHAIMTDFAIHAVRWTLLLLFLHYGYCEMSFYILYSDVKLFAPCLIVIPPCFLRSVQILHIFIAILRLANIFMDQKFLGTASHLSIVFLGRLFFYTMNGMWTVRQLQCQWIISRLSIFFAKRLDICNGFSLIGFRGVHQRTMVRLFVEIMIKGYLI